MAESNAVPQYCQGQSTSGKGRTCVCGYLPTYHHQIVGMETAPDMESQVVEAELHHPVAVSETRETAGGIKKLSTNDSFPIKGEPFQLKEPLTRRQKVRRHWKRFRCCYLLLGVVVLAIILPIAFLVILPAIVQALVNSSNLPIYGGAFLANSPDSAIVSISTALKIPSGIHATIDPFTLHLYDKSITPYTPFLGLDVARTTLNGNTAVALTNQTVAITNTTELATWLGGVFQNAETPMSVRGAATLHVGALTYHVALDKTETLQTLDSLAGFTFDTLQLIVPPAATDGANVMGTVTLPNRSPLTIGLGNVTLNILSGNYNLGYATIADVVVPPGNQTLSFRGWLDYEYVLGNIGPIIASQASALKDGNVEVGATGNSSVVDGVHIEYVEEVLQAQYLTTQIPILELVAQLTGQVLANGSAVNGALEGLLEDLENITGVDGGDRGSPGLTGIFGNLAL